MTETETPAFGAEQFVELYKQMPEDHSKLADVAWFDDARKLEFEAALLRAGKEKDPAARYQELGKVYGAIKQTAGIFVGMPLVSSMELAADKRIQMAAQMGTETLDELL